MKGKKFRCLSLLASLLLVFAAGFAGVAFADDDDDGDTGLGALDDVALNPTLRPFSLVEIVPAVRVDREVDHELTDEKAYEVAFAIAKYVATTDETVELGTIDNWILGGFEGDPAEMTEEEIDEAVAAAILGIPTNYPIDPDDPESAMRKVNLFEICNKTFAKKALGLSPVVEASEEGEAIYIENGYIHAPALPCEIAVYSDDEKDRIRVEMLNPEAIFTLFFTDVVFGDQMYDEDFAAAVQELPGTVNREIQSIIYAAVEDKGTQSKVSKSVGSLLRNVNENAEQSKAKTHDGSKTKGKRVTRVRPLGPKYTSLIDVAKVVAETEYESPYVHVVYTKSDATGELSFTQDEAQAVAQGMITVLEGDKAGLDLNFTWKSPRPAPLPVPGNFLVEACSPENAKAAMDMGMYHATALPCAVSTRAQDYDGDGIVELFVTYLNPHFMFNAMFSDAFSDLSEEAREGLEQWAADLLADLQTMMGAAIEDFDEAQVEFEVTGPDPVWFDMLPNIDLDDILGDDE